MTRIGEVKDIGNIVDEWDAIATTREDQISSGKDHSATNVLAPAILEQIDQIESIIDIGCGTGWLTTQLASKASSVVGVDPSSVSIAIAKRQHSSIRISYVAETIEQHARGANRYDLAVSNMTLSAAPDLERFLLGARGVLDSGSLLLLTIPHPCFWPLYWGYGSDPSFDYMESCSVVSEFKIQSETTNFCTTHFHRPVKRYIAELTKSGFFIESIDELLGSGFNFPRFMLIRARVF